MVAVASQPIAACMIPVQDTREQNPWNLPGAEVDTLPWGDYSIRGCERIFVLERKNIDDLVGCVTRERPRFERELTTLRGFDFAAVIVEANIASCAAWMLDYVPVIFGGSPAHCADLAHRLMTKFWNRRVEAAKELLGR